MGAAKYPREWEWQMNIDEHAGLVIKGEKLHKCTRKCKKTNRFKDTVTALAKNLKFS